LAIFWGVSGIIFASPLALATNRIKDSVFLIAHFNIKFSTEFMALHMQRSPLRGPGHLRRMTDGELKRSTLGDDIIQPEHVEALLEYEKFIYVNDVSEEQLDLYAKLPERGKALKKFMQYAVEFIPVNFRCMQTESMPYPFTEHQEDNEAEAFRLAGDREIGGTESMVHDWLVGKEFLRSSQGKRLLDLPKDLNR